MKNKILKNILVNKSSSIKEAMRAIDKNTLGVAFVVDEKKRLLGVVTDGDIRRAILKGVNIKSSIEEIANKKPVIIKGELKERELHSFKNKEEVKRKIPCGSSLKVPIIDEGGKIKDILFVYSDEKKNFLLSQRKNFKPNKEAIKKVLVIGGAGYLGSVLCRKLLKKGYKVRVLDNLTYGDRGIRELYDNKNFEFLKGDIRNISDVIEGIKEVDAVIHLAAIVGDPACASNPEKTLETNYLATKIITETCKYFQINRFIFASTCSVYGESHFPDKKLTEESPLNPVSLYAETKIKCEQSILEAMDENFSPTILRMATLYGYSPLMRFDLAINLLTARAIFDKKITIFGGSQWRPWLHLQDAATAYILCLESPIEKIKGEIFNVVSENYKIIDVGKIINSICPEARLEISRKVIDKRDYNVSFAKISQILHCRPKKKLTDGIKEIKGVIDKGLISDYRNLQYRVSLS